MADQARAEGRWLITKDRELAAVGPRSVLLRSDDLESQLVELFGRLRLQVTADLEGSRCGECNGTLEPVTRDQARDAVPPYVHRTAARFRRCLGCGRHYWPGTHTDSIVSTMAAVVARLDERNGRSDSGASGASSVDV